MLTVTFYAWKVTNNEVTLTFSVLTVTSNEVMDPCMGTKPVMSLSILFWRASSE